MLCLKKLKIILLSNLWLVVLILFTTIFCYPSLNIEKNSEEIKNYKFSGYINKLVKEENKIQFELIGDKKVLANLYIKEKGDYSYLNNLELGDYIEVIGILQIPSENTNFNLFNYRKYLLSKKIEYIIIIEQLEIINKNNNVLYSIKNHLIKLIEKNTSSNYLKAFILGDTSNIDDKVKTSFQVNGISHLFSVSGMHVGFLSAVIISMLNLFNKRKTINEIIVIIILIFYSFLTGFSPSILRSVIFMILLFLKKIFYLPISSFKMFLSMTCLFLIYNPWYLYNTGFLYSFIISGFLIYFNKLYKDKSYFKKVFFISLISFLVSLPITLFNSFEINIISIFLNLIFVPFVSFIIFPFSFIVMIFPFFSKLYEFLIIILENLSLLSSDYLGVVLSFSKPNMLGIIIYYLIILIILSYPRNKVIYLFLGVYFLVYYNINLFNFTSKITMLDVEQGDSILFQFPNNKGNILIDTGGRYNYSLSENVIIPYLQSTGIRSLDYLILSHGDYDHMGEAINLVNNFKVEKVIFNCGEFNELEHELIKVLDKKKISYYSCIKELNIDNNKLYFLNNKDYGNENDNSSVIYTKLHNYKFLFMGDAGVEVEDYLLKKYNLKNIDVLKVGHHGSKTSSSQSFIDEINPKYSVISVGKNNRYGHPNKDVLNNLDNSKIYRTDIDGSIMFKIRNNKLKIETCPP